MQVATGLKRTNPKKGKDLIFKKENECIVCVSHTKTDDGYIRIFAGKGVKPRQQLLHRIIWQHHKGEIPDKYEIDHICRNRKCCNIEHLQMLERSEHKSKGNKVRYSERISLVKKAILDKTPTEVIMETYKVPRHYVTRYIRVLKNAIH